MTPSVERKTWQTAAKSDAKATSGYLSKEPTMTERAFNKNTRLHALEAVEVSKRLSCGYFRTCLDVPTCTTGNWMRC